MEFMEKYAKNSDEKILLGRISDMLQRSEKTYSAVYSQFLSPAEQTLISRVDELRAFVSFDGGYADAERRVCRVCFDEYCRDDGAPVVLLCADIKAKNAGISHRDVLGSLMGLGINRDTIGDIITDGQRVQFFCIQSVCEHIEFNLHKIGRYEVDTKLSDNSVIIQKEKTAKSINVSSMRLDCICAEGFGMSRSKASEYIKKGLVCVNWLVCDSTSKEIHKGDKISLRGKGKLEISEITGHSKKGRLFLTVLK